VSLHTVSYEMKRIERKSSNVQQFQLSVHGTTSSFEYLFQTKSKSPYQWSYIFLKVQRTYPSFRGTIQFRLVVSTSGQHSKPHYTVLPGFDGFCVRVRDLCYLDKTSPPSWVKRGKRVIERCHYRAMYEFGYSRRPLHLQANIFILCDNYVLQDTSDLPWCPEHLQWGLTQGRSFIHMPHSGDSWEISPFTFTSILTSCGILLPNYACRVVKLCNFVKFN